MSDRVIINALIESVRKYIPKAFLQFYGNMYCIEDGEGRRISEVTASSQSAWGSALSFMLDGGKKV